MKKIAVEEHTNQQDLNHLDKRLEDMDEAGIDMQVMSYSLPNVNDLGSEEAVSMAKDANDTLARVCERYPQRFAGYAALPLQNPEAAANELERAVKNLGLKRTMIFSNTKGEYLDNQKYWVILERAEKLGVPIYLHPSHPSPDMIKPYLTYPILSGSMWGYAAEAGLHAMRLICRGTFDRYPGLKIILGHLGEAIPFWLWRMDNRWLREKDTVYKTDIFASKLKRKPSQYFKDNFYVTTSGMFWPPVLQFVLSVLGADRILFAVDYPPESAIEAAQFMDSMPMNDSDKEKICHLNAEKILRL